MGTEIHLNDAKNTKDGEILKEARGKIQGNMME